MEPWLSRHRSVHVQFIAGMSASEAHVHSQHTASDSHVCPRDSACHMGLPFAFKYLRDLVRSATVMWLKGAPKTEIDEQVLEGRPVDISKYRKVAVGAKCN